MEDLFQSDSDAPQQDLPIRGKHYVEPRGYFGAPGSGPVGTHCRACAHYVSVRYHNKTYPKCQMNSARWTHGRASDILAGSPSCKYFEEPQK